MKWIIPLLFAATTLHAADKVTWTTPSKESLDSMPLSGRLGAGVNVWVQDGSIWLYLGHSGAFNSQGILNKLGWPNLANGDADLFLPSLHYYRDRSPAADRDWPSKRSAVLVTPKSRFPSHARTWT